MIKTLSALKRDCDKYSWEVIQFGSGEIPARLKGLRTVAIKQTNSIKFTPTAGGSDGSWMYFDTAKNFRFSCDNDTENPIVTMALNEDGDFSESIVYR